VTRCHQCGTSANEGDRFCAACGATLQVQDEPSSPGDPLIGRTVGGAYLIQELIGVGGMGRVYRGIQNALGRTVAIKVVHPHLLGDEQTVARFYNEARAASRLNHPASVGVIDFGRTEDGNLYLVMEFLSGKDLGTVMAEEGPLPFTRIILVVRKILSGLSEAHALGVVHRDLKPENVILQRSRKGDESVKVVDFGLATITGAQATSITTPGLVCGTPDYMSPEQARGDQLDHRSDIYSMGVVLFELLADRLPFVDDTPTKVVLRHIHDPIPDPRQVAPHRGVPAALAEIAIRALSKDAPSRYQTADEMDEALRRAQETEARGAEIRCSACGAVNQGARFCAECGNRLTGKSALMDTGPRPVVDGDSSPGMRTSQAPSLGRRPLLGRDADLRRIEMLREQRASRGVWVRIVGEAGMGKTRLLTEIAARTRAQGDVVVLVGPHASWAPVPYFAVRALLAGLFDVDEPSLGDLADSAMVQDPLVRAGLAEVMNPRGLVGVPGGSRAGAVGEALRAAVQVGVSRAESGGVVLLVDDVARLDGLSRQAILSAFSDPSSVAGALLVTALSNPREVPASKDAVNMILRGLDETESAQFLSGALGTPQATTDLTPAPQRLYLPLYLEQLQAIGVNSLSDESVPARLADAVTARLERLDRPARRTLQAAATLGERCDLRELRALTGEQDITGFDTLLRHGLVRMHEGAVEIAHPFIRELVEASIPAEARRDLHARALSIASEAEAPLEIRAEHAAKTGETMSALLLLERMGDIALSRGDSIASVLAFRRGLELARRELLETGELSLDRAIITFSRKLGIALDCAGDLTGADGVLREALELTGPSHKERPRMLLQLGRVASRRDRGRDAMRFLGQAIETAGKLKDSVTEAEAQLELGLLRRADGDLVAAANTLRRACELLALVDGADANLAAASLEYTEALMELGDAELAEEHLLVAHSRARAAGSGALAAKVSGLRAASRAAAGDSNGALTLYREAEQLASEAGDAATAERYRRAARDAA